MIMRGLIQRLRGEHPLHAAAAQAGSLHFSSRALASMLFGMSGGDAAPFEIAVCVLAAAAAIGITVPALRAARVDPMQALRQE